MSITRVSLFSAVLAIGACATDASTAPGIERAPGEPDALDVPGDGVEDDDFGAGEFVATNHGGYKLGPEVVDGDPLVSDDAETGDVIDDDDDDGEDNDAGEPASTGCEIMMGVVRDFQASNVEGGHPDFESYVGGGPTSGLVAQQLGADGKPVYASRCESTPDAALCPHGQQTSGKSAFDTWYRTTEGVNIARALYLTFDEQNGMHTFGSDSFFPLDGAGYGNSDAAGTHNYGFTTELHAKFQYNGGERFTFSGDDDLWVFINGKLAIDLGGLHYSAVAELDLEAQAGVLGLEPGKVYPIDLFHAERHTEYSNFRVDTNLAFTDCGGAAAAE